MRFSADSLNAGVGFQWRPLIVMSICRPRSWRIGSDRVVACACAAARSGVPAPRPRGKDPEGLAVFGHRPPRDPESRLLEHLRDALVAHRVELVLAVDQ